MRLNKGQQLFRNQFKSKRPDRTSKRKWPALQLELLESRLAPTVSILSNFAGISGGNPPDTCGAAGPNSYVETINTSVEIFNKITGDKIDSDGLNDFLFTVGGISKIGRLADATMVYDEPIGRFIVADMDWDSVNHKGALDFAVSTSSNPTKLDAFNWKFYQLNSEDGYDLDYPGNFGYNADAWVYTLQEFAPGNSDDGDGGEDGGDVGPQTTLTSHSLVTCISQSDLAAGGSIGGIQFDLSGFSYRPTTMHDSAHGDPMWLIQEGGDNQSINLIRVDNVLDVNGSNSSFNLSVNSYNNVNNPLNPDGSVIIPGRGKPDGRILKAAEANNTIVACQTVGVGTNEDDARWYMIDVSDINHPVIANQGNFGFGANTYTVYPSIDINPAGDIGLAFSKVGTDDPNDFVHADVVGMNSSDGGDMEHTAIIFGGGNTDINGRLGDFSGINVDPVNGTFWTAQETSNGGTTTQIANWTMSNGGEAFVKNGVLVATGTNADDHFTLQPFSFLGLTFTEIDNNGVDLGDFLNGTFSSISVFGFGGNDSLAITDNGGSKGLDFYNGVSIAFDGGTGTNSVFLDDSTASFSDTYTITSSTVSRVVFGGLTYSNVQSVTLDMENGNDTVNIESTSAAVTVNMGSGTDTVNIAPSSQFLDNIQGDVFVNGGSGFDTLNIADQNDPFSDTWTISGSSITRTAAATIFYNLQNIVTITGGTGNLTYNIQSTEAGFSTNLNTGPGNDTVNIESTNSGSSTTVNDGNGTDTVNISPAAEFLDNIQGNVFVHGGFGFDTLNTFDQNDSFSGDIYTITSSIIQRSFSALITYDLQNVTNINTGTGSPTLNVLSTSFFTTNLFGYSATTVNIGNSGSVQGILGTLNIENRPSFTTINVDDSADGTARIVTLGQFTGSDDGDGDSDLFGYIFGLAPGIINYEFFDTSSVTITTGTRADTVNVLATGKTTNLNSGGGTDTVNVGNAGSLQDIHGTLNIENRPSFTTINVDDSADGTPRTVTLGQFTASDDGDGDSDLFGSIAGLAPAHINYEYFDTSSVTITTGTQADTVNVLATGVTTNLNSGGGGDMVNVGNAGSLQDIHGTLNIENRPSFTTINVNDSADGSARTVTLSQFTASDDGDGDSDLFGSIAGLAPAHINYEYLDTSSVTITTGTQADTVNVLATGVTTNLNSSGGGDTINVGSATNTFDTIQGPVTVNGDGASTKLNVYDQGTTTTNNWDIASTFIDRFPLGGSPPAIPQITYHNVGTVMVTTGMAQTFIGIESTSAGTTTIVKGNNSGDEFIVEDALNLLDDIQGPLTLHGSGLDFFSAVDSGNTIGHTYTMTTGKLQRDGMADITYDGMGEFVLSTADNHFGHTPSTVNVQSFNVVFAVLAIAKGDTVTVGQSGSMAGILGELRIQGTIGQTPNKITLDDSADATGHTVTLQGNDPTFGYLVKGLLPSGGRIGFLSLDATTPVTILGGLGNDLFNVHDFMGAPALTIDAGSGTNTLDYSAYTGDINVDLPLGSATGFAGIAHIQNVTGSIGNDLLVGDANANTLNGGTLRNIIIGGGGADILTGSVNQDNILIGGTTMWDMNLPDLMLIMHEWLRMDLNFSQRFSDIKDGGVGIMGSVLTGTGVALNNTTVFHDNVADTLNEPSTNTTGQYWFFIDSIGDDIVPFSKGGKFGDKTTKV
jgi:hypothetical protein